MLLKKMGAGVVSPGAARLRKAAVFGFVIMFASRRHAHVPAPCSGGSGLDFSLGGSQVGPGTQPGVQCRSAAWFRDLAAILLFGGGRGVA